MLNDNLSTINIFGGRRVIICNLLQTLLTKNIENTLFEAITKKNDNCVLIVKAENINKQNKLIKYLEKSNECILAPCYEEETNNIRNKILNIFQKYNFNYSNQFISDFTANFSADSLINKMEFEKLENLLYKNPLVSEDRLLSFITDNEDKPSEKIINLCASGNLNGSLSLFNNTFNKSVSSISMIRQFGYHFKLIEKIILLQKKGSNLDDAVNNVRPPIFFKNKPSITYQCNLWQLKKINLVLKKLIDLELRCKMNIYSEKTLISQFILYASTLAIQKTKT